MERNRERPTLPWVKGEFLSMLLVIGVFLNGTLGEKSCESVSVFEFNKERRGWHYGWASNKHTCNSEHFLQCFVVDKTESTCKATCESPYFMLFCRRRRRFTMVPSAPVAPPNKRLKIKIEQDSADPSIMAGPKNPRQSRSKSKGEVDALRMDTIMKKLGMDLYVPNTAHLS